MAGSRILPTFERLTKAELIEYIRYLAETKPALVHQTGKHVRLMEKVFRHVSQELKVPRFEWYRAFTLAIQHAKPLATVSLPEQNEQRYTVSAVARPEVDLERLAKALRGLAE